jgi:hypothetical protein
MFFRIGGALLATPGNDPGLGNANAHGRNASGLRWANPGRRKQRPSDDIGNRLHQRQF